MNAVKPLGAQLVEKGLLTDDQVRIALIEQKATGDPLGRILVRLGFITEAVARDTLSASFGQDSIDLSQVVADPEALALVPLELARRHKVLPVSYDQANGTLTIAMADTFDMIALDQVNANVGPDIKVVAMLAGEGEIDAQFDQFYGYELSVDGILEEIETGEIDYAGMEAAGLQEYRQPVVRLVDALLVDAVKRRASDIHFEPEAEFGRIRYRIDGVMRQIRSLHRNYWPAIVVRLKIIAGMNIAETRAPQDGRITLRVQGRQVDFRVSAQPTVHGENIVLRILDRNQSIMPVEALGLTDAALQQLSILISRPEGIILVTGPTGSGKTTTLYSILNHVNSDTVNIMTLEDPVEYPMTMIRQTSINEVAKMNFADGIRSLMRQDPDIILVGEIRDNETAEMAFRAAMTGHQVYSTLHTNSALGAIPRLSDMGIRPDVMAGNIIGVLAQRLLRKLCPRCKKAYQPEPLERRLLGLDDEFSGTLYRAEGCTACEMTGYRGRMALTEILRINEEIDDLISRAAPLREIRQAAASSGFVPMAEDGTRYVLSGITSLDEVTRVVDLASRITA